MMLFNYIIRKCTGGNTFSKLQEKHQPPYVEGGYETICKNEKELETLIQIIRIYSQDRGMEFGIKMCHANNEKWKRQIIEGIELPNQDKIKTLQEKETYKCLGSGHPQTIGDERKNKKVS